MTNSIGFVLFNLGCAVVLCILIYRMQRDKQLEITLISGPVTKVEKIILKGKGLALAKIGWGISALLFTFSGLISFSNYVDTETYYLITFISGSLAVLTMLIASYVTTHFQE